MLHAPVRRLLLTLTAALACGSFAGCEGFGEVASAMAAGAQQGAQQQQQQQAAQPRRTGSTSAAGMR